MAMRGMPADHVVLDVLRDIVPLLNPLVPHCHGGPTSDSGS
jgi:hypothetical protein